MLGANDSKIDSIKSRTLTCRLSGAYFKIGEKLLSDDGLAKLLYYTENGVLGVKWCCQSLLILLSSSFCLVLDPGTPGAQHVGYFTAHGTPELRSTSKEKSVLNQLALRHLFRANIMTLAGELSFNMR